MAQEQEYKYSNVCVPNPTWQERQNKDAQLPLKGSASGGLPALAAFPALPGSKQRCAAELSPTHTDRRSQCDNSFSRTILGGKESEEAGRKGKVIEAPHQASLGGALQEGVGQQPHPSLGLCRQEAELRGEPRLKAERRNLPQEHSAEEPPTRAQR